MKVDFPPVRRGSIFGGSIPFFIDKEILFDYRGHRMPTDEEKEQFLRYQIIEYARSFILHPYFYGGDDPWGIDCSGFVIECDKSVGLFLHNFDDSADGLWNRMKHAIVPKARPGDHVFWFDGDRASHVELAVNQYQTIGASGGGVPRYDLFMEIRNDPFLFDNYVDEEGEIFKDVVIVRMIEDFLKREEAIRRNGFVKIRPMTYRGTGFKICDPFRMGV